MDYLYIYESYMRMGSIPGLSDYLVNIQMDPNGWLFRMFIPLKDGLMPSRYWIISLWVHRGHTL